MAAIIKHFLDIGALSPAEIRGILDYAHQLKSIYIKGEKSKEAPLSGKTLAMIFKQNSTRTRVSFDVAMRQLGGETLLISGNDSQMGRGETMADTAHVLSRYVDAIMIRMHDHSAIEELASHTSIPVINGLSQRSHPCQVLADIMTFEEHIGPIEGKKISWFGDWNNVLFSWVEAAMHFDFTLSIAVPNEVLPDQQTLNMFIEKGADLELSTDVAAIASDADCLMSDTWVSMGDEDVIEEENRKIVERFLPYQVTEELMQLAKPSAIFMHCLPAYRDKEVATSVIDGPQSVIFDEAENRLHAQKAILAWCFNII